MATGLAGQHKNVPGMIMNGHHWQADLGAIKHERERQRQRGGGGREAGGSKLAALVAANMEMLYRYIWYI